jgi:hypothetical protein
VGIESARALLAARPRCEWQRSDQTRLRTIMALGAVAVAPPASGYATATSGSAIELGLKPFHAQ